MNIFNKRKLVEIVLYILNKTDGLDYYHVFKIIYFANASHLAQYGLRLTTDEFCALPDGPVPSELYNCIRDYKASDKEFEQMLDSAITTGEDDAYYMLSAKRKANLDYISQSEKEEIDKSIKANANLPYNVLRSKSHGNEWKRAFYSSEKGKKVMDTIGIARDAFASEGMLDYIKEELEVEAALA